MEKSTSVGVKWGLTLGGILVAMTVIFYIISISLFINLVFSFVFPLIIVIIIGFLATKEYKAQNNSFGSFGNLFKNILITYAIGILISVIVRYILFHFIDSDAGQQITELSIEKVVEFTEKMGGEIPEESLGKMEESVKFDLKDTISTFMLFTFGNILIGLIIAAITKNEKPEFE